MGRLATAVSSGGVGGGSDSYAMSLVCFILAMVAIAWGLSLLRKSKPFPVAHRRKRR